MSEQPILGADLLLRLGIDASGVATELSSKLTAVERQAVAQGKTISTAYGQANDRVVASQLKVVAAQERVNRVMAQERATIGQRATAASGLIAAQQRYNTELSKTAATTTTVAVKERERFSGLRSTVAAGIGFAGAATLVDTIRQAKDAAVDYQDVVSANDVTFGRQRTQLERFKRLQADQLNLSRLQVEQAANTFGQVFRSAGSGQAQALQQGLALTQRAADVRSFRGGQLQDVQDAFRSALVGETEPIRRYGVLLDDARLRLRAFDLGLVATTKETLPPAVKAQAAYAEILAQTSSAAGDVARTADSAANKIEDQRQKAADAKQVLGEGLLPVISELATAGAEVAPVLADVARGIGAVLGNDAARRTIELGAAVAVVTKLGGALNSFVNNAQEKISRNIAIARSYDAVASSATRAAIAEGGASRAGTVGGRFSGGRGQLVGLGALGLLAAGTGGVGSATGSGLANGATNVLSGALTGAGIGSFFPGPGTLIGGAVGAAAGLGLSIFGPSGAPARTTTRTPKQVAADLREVNAELARIRASQGPGTVAGAYAQQARTGSLTQRQRSLSDELKVAREEGRKTFEVFDQGTGTFKNMTTAQIAAASAAAEHSKQLQAERDRFAQLRDSFDVDPFAKAGKQKALDPEAAMRRLTRNVDRQIDLRRDFARIAGRGASREVLDTLRDLEGQAPGTVHRIAQQTGRGFQRELARELRRLNRQSNMFAHLFDDAPDEAEKAARRAARRAARAARDEMNEYFRHNPPQFTFATPGNVPFVAQSSGVNRRRRQP